jgi:DNA-binding GntR family transcriptional regulator
MSTTPAKINVYEAILNDIADGVLRPNERLGEESLGLKWNVSRTPVREAFLRLEAEGLVERRPNYGTYIREPDRAELAELMDLRQLVECHVVRKLASSATAAELDELTMLAQAADRVGVHARVSAAVKAESDFHFRLCELARLRHTLRLFTISHLLTQSFVIQARSVAVTHEPSRLHVDIVDALLRRDPDAASREMHRHIALSIEALALSSAERRGEPPAEKPGTASLDIYEKFIEELTAGTIDDSETLADETLAARWKVSRAPVREAMARLEVEGLVERRGRAGTFIRKPDPEEVAELMELRALIETHVARNVAVHATDAELDELAELAEVADRAGGQPEWEPLVQAEADFHLRLCAVARLRHTLRMLKVSHLLIQGVTLTLRAASSWPGLAHEHRDLVAAFRRRDPEVAAQAMKRHVLEALKSTAELQVSSPPPRPPRSRGSARHP